MKTHATLRSSTAAVIGLLCLHTTTDLHAQGGSLTPPPGPPSLVMHTMDEIYERADRAAHLFGGYIPSSETAQALHLIDLSDGLYRLHRHLLASGNGLNKTNLRVSGGNVTIDLNGFTIGGGTIGIEVVGYGPVVIRNGVIRNCGRGIVAGAHSEVILRDVTILDSTGKAIDIVGGTLERVTVKGAVGHGIYATGARWLTIRDCTVSDITHAEAGIDAPKAAVSDTTVCNVSGAGTYLSGIQADGGLVRGCTVRQLTNTAANQVYGIAGAASAVDCTVEDLHTTPGGHSPANISWGIHRVKLVSRCVVSVIKDASRCFGISAEAVSDSEVHDVGAAGNLDNYGIIGSSISHCRVSGVPSALTSGIGIAVEAGGNVSGCSVVSCDKGITPNDMSLVSGNSLNLCTIGIADTAIGSSRIINNTVRGNGSSSTHGILSAGGNASYFEGNSVSNLVTGFQAAEGSTAIFVRNVAAANCTTKFDIPAAMIVVTPATLGTNPNANIAH